MATYKSASIPGFACGFFLAFLCLNNGAVAQERTLQDQEIATLLPRIIAYGEKSRQHFSSDGTTSYIYDGRPSSGRWRVNGGKYCSQWPPNSAWDCYTVKLDDNANRLVWIDKSGNETVNSFEHINQADNPKGQD